jgi:predicted MFS family arabinose efflux permease
VLLLAAATAAAAYLQASLSVLSVYLVSDLGITRSQLGIAFAAFSVIGGLVAPLVGSVADRSTRMVMVGLFGLSAVSVLATAAAPNYAWLLVAAVIGGISFAAGNPVTNRLVFEEVSPARRGLAMGIKQTGPPLALLAAGVFVPPVATQIGWRWAFGVTAVAPLLGMAVTGLLVPREEPHSGERATGSDGDDKPRDVAVLWLTWASLVASAGIGAVIAFVPLYAHERLGLAESAAGAVAALIGLFGVAGRIMWGAAAHRLPDPVSGLGFVAAAALGATALIWAASGTPGLIWLAAVAVGFSMPAWHVVAWLALLERRGRSGVGRATGVVHLGTSFGFAAGPPLMGALVDGLGSYDWGWAMVVGMFAVTVILMAVWRSRER